MAFEEVTVDIARGPQRTGCAVSLVKMRGAPARLRVALRENALHQLGYKAGDRLAVLIGTGEDHGLIRLRKDQNGTATLNERDGPHGSRWWEVSLGRRPEFVDRSEKAVDCQWEKIDLVTMEIALPAWADETRPRPAKAVTVTPPSVSAGRREQERQAREHADANQRREERAAIEESEAFAELTRRLDAATSAAFDPALRLTKTEKALLTILSDRAGRVVGKEALTLLLYSDRPDDPPEEKLVDVFVCKIRPKIAGTGCSIETVWGEGYRFNGDQAALLKGARAA